jgi:hypothetical protein
MGGNTSKGNFLGGKFSELNLRRGIYAEGNLRGGESTWRGILAEWNFQRGIFGGEFSLGGKFVDAICN